MRGKGKDTAGLAQCVCERQFPPVDDKRLRSPLCSSALPFAPSSTALLALRWYSRAVLKTNTLLSPPSWLKATAHRLLACDFRGWPFLFHRKKMGGQHCQLSGVCWGVPPPSPPFFHSPPILCAIACLTSTCYLPTLSLAIILFQSTATYLPTI